MGINLNEELSKERAKKATTKSCSTVMGSGGKKEEVNLCTVVYSDTKARRRRKL